MAGIIFSEGSNLNNSIFGEVQYPIKMFLEAKAEEFENNSALPNLFNEMSSEHSGELLTGLTAMNGFQPVGENGEYPNDEMQESDGKFLRNVTWKDKFSISEEMIEDSQTIDLRKRPDAFIKGFYRTKEEFGAALFGGAIGGSNKTTFKNKEFDLTCADGMGLFNTAHKAKIRGAAQSNKFSDAFSADALAAAECAMQNFRGDNNEILAVHPNTILIPNVYELKRDVFAVIGADKDPETANNGFNFHFGRWTVVVWNYLNEYITANTKPWVLLDSNYNESAGGAVWFNRRDLTIKSEIAENDANVWKGRARFIAGFNDWRFAAVGGASGGTELISA